MVKKKIYNTHNLTDKKQLVLIANVMYSTLIIINYIFGFLDDKYPKFQLYTVGIHLGLIIIMENKAKVFL